MQRNFRLKLLFLFFYVFFIYTLSLAILLPETPDGKIGKNYQLYAFVSTGFGITKKNFDYATNYYVFGLRSNLGTDSFDFGIFFDYSVFTGLSADIKYGLIKDKNFSCAIDFSLSKPFIDGFLIKTGSAFNLAILPSFELVVSSYYIYSFYELQTMNETSFPHGYSIYFYGGIGFQPPFLIDNTITLGCGYLYLPDNLSDNQKFFNQIYLNIFIRHAFNEPKVEKKSLISSNDIVKNEKEEKNINENILIAKELIKIKEYKKAILVLGDALYFYPDNFTLNYLLADCYYNTGDKIKASIYYKKASAINTIDLKLKEVLNSLEMEIKNEKK